MSLSRPVRGWQSGVRFLALLLLSVGLSTPRAAGDAEAMDKFGVNTHLHRTATTDWSAQCDDIIASGIKWVRLTPEWHQIETDDGVYNANYLIQLDGIVNKLTANGVNILFMLGYTAPWANSITHPLDPRHYPPDDIADWESYVTYIADRYDHKIQYWQVWNEPDHGFWKGTPGEYAALLRAAADKIHQANANNKVVLGGLAMNTYGDGTFFDQILAESGTPAAIDIVAYHAYGSMTGHRLRHEAMMDLMEEYDIDDRDIWITETGYSSYGESELEAYKADYQNELHLFNLNLSNVKRLFNFTHRNLVVAGSLGARESNFGLTDLDRTPLPALYAYQACDGAEAEPILQAQWPSIVEPLRSLYYVPAVAGDGSHVVNYLHAPGSWKCIYYRVDDSWMYDSVGETILADVTYLDIGTGTITLQYDSTGNNYQGVNIYRGSSGQELTTTLTLSSAQFANGQNNFADLRFISSSEMHIVSLKVRRPSGVGGTLHLRHVDAPAGDGSFVTPRYKVPTNYYMYLRVNDNWIYDANSLLDTVAYLDVTYLDNNYGTINVQYDSWSNGAYASATSIAKQNTGTWKTDTITLPGIKFINRQNNQADFRIQAGGGQDLVLSKVVLRRDMSKGRIVMRDPDRFRLLDRPDSTTTTHEHYNPLTYFQSRYCRQILDNNHYINIRVSDALVASGQPNVRIGVSFWDPGTGGKLGIQYNATGGVNYKNVTINKNQSMPGQWRWVNVDLTDADFRNAQDLGNADFRIHNGQDGSVEYVEQIDVSLYD